MSQHVHRTPSAEDGRRDAGLSVVEVMVAMVILAIMMAAIASGLVSSLRVTDLASERTVATQVATRAVELFRARPFEVILADLGVRRYEEVVDGEAFEVRIDAYWVGVDAGFDPCEATEDVDASAVVRVEIDVTPESESINPIHLETVVSPPGGTVRPDAGTVIVRVRDHRGEPVPLALTSARSDAHTPGVTTTRADGCASFGNVDPGTYVVDVRRDGHVTERDEPAASDPSVPVVANATAVTEIRLAPQAAARIVERTAGPRTTLPDARAVRVLGGLVPHERNVPPGGGPVLVDGLYPSTRRAVAGVCHDADPLALDAEGNPVWTAADVASAVETPLVPGAATDLDARYATVWVTFVNPAMTVHATNTDCPDEPVTLTWEPVLANMNPTRTGHRIAVPFGTWEFRTDIGIVRRTVTLHPADWTDVVAVVLLPGGEPPPVSPPAFVLDVDAPGCSLDGEPAHCGDLKPDDVRDATTCRVGGELAGCAAVADAIDRVEASGTDWKEGADLLAAVRPLVHDDVCGLDGDYRRCGDTDHERAQADSDTCSVDVYAVDCEDLGRAIQEDLVFAPNHLVVFPLTGGETCTVDGRSEPCAVTDREAAQHGLDCDVDGLPVDCKELRKQIDELMK